MHSGVNDTRTQKRGPPDQFRWFALFLNLNKFRTRDKRPSAATLSSSSPAPCSSQFPPARSSEKGDTTSLGFFHSISSIRVHSYPIRLDSSAASVPDPKPPISSAFPPWYGSDLIISFCGGSISLSIHIRCQILSIFWFSC